LRYLVLEPAPSSVVSVPYVQCSRWNMDLMGAVICDEQYTTSEPTVVNYPWRYDHGCPSIFLSTWTTPYTLFLLLQGLAHNAVLMGISTRAGHAVARALLGCCRCYVVRRSKRRTWRRSLSRSWPPRLVDSIRRGMSPHYFLGSTDARYSKLVSVFAVSLSIGSFIPSVMVAGMVSSIAQLYADTLLESRARVREVTPRVSAKSAVDEAETSAEARTLSQLRKHDGTRAVPPSAALIAFVSWSAMCFFVLGAGSLNADVMNVFGGSSLAAGTCVSVVILMVSAASLGWVQQAGRKPKAAVDTEHAGELSEPLIARGEAHAD
jgi:hypothetical protein